MEQSWLSIALLGHEHVGKSTTLGHILEKVGILDEHSSHKIRREAKLAGKECLGYAWVSMILSFT